MTNNFFGLDHSSGNQNDGQKGDKGLTLDDNKLREKKRKIALE